MDLKQYNRQINQKQLTHLTWFKFSNLVKNK